MKEKRIEAEAWDEGVTFRSLAELSPEAIFVHSRGEILYINEKAAQLFGAASPQSCLGKSILDFVHPDERERLGSKLASLSREPKTRLLQEETIVRADGTAVVLEWSVVPMTFRGRLARQVVFRDISPRKRAEEELQTSREEYRRLSDHLEVIRELERAEISREIHDQVGQPLAALMMDLSWLKARMPPASSSENPKVGERIHQMSSILRRAMASVRSITDQLRPALLDHLGLGAAIENHAQEFQNNTGIPCQVQISPEDLSLRQETALGLFRIFQMALAGIDRNPQVGSVQVNLETSGRDLLLRVRHMDTGEQDNALASEASLDLLNIRERARNLGGWMRTHHSGKYFQIETRVPLQF